ncbi:hypothetical protein [Saccharomonospora xinjiangensis]|uniref:Uncharacterized protein n=1 Tax=Saccharomonospora xinjiangensis XJ-54 TaxID=882086 RepID=I0V8S1_9PSEU|nr:hypothetical protein [Saccharomonospora xinjiangensis]EID56524.1 hypothetical protein SacxiDRAFT_4343 [Saccharomonospora xinjiangensis XJ-54]
MTDTSYAALLATLDELAERTEPQVRLAWLHDLIAPLLDRVEQEDDPLSDEPRISTPDAVRAWHRAAAGDQVDVDAVYDQLMTVGLVYSEDQDPDLHVISQTAYAAAAWLRLLTGRDLRSTVEDEEEVEGIEEWSGSSVFTQIIDMLAWTRTGQVYTFWQDAAADPGYCDFPVATRELDAMVSTLVHRA